VDVAQNFDGSNRIFKVMNHAAVQELLAKCHPLGMFDAIATLAVASNMRELYRLVLVGCQRAYALTCLSTSDCLQTCGECGLPHPFPLSTRVRVHHAEL
jgi:hypothetical protein